MTTIAKQLCLSLFLSIMISLTGCGGSASDVPGIDIGIDDDDFGSGEVASVDEGQIPGYQSGSSVSGLVATSNGLYMHMIDASGATILKLHGNPIFDNWSSASFPVVYDFAPVNPYNEQEDEISFYWASGDEWGLYTANTGTPGFTEQDDISIQRVAAGGREGVITPRPWVVASDNPHNLGSYYWLYQDDGQYSAGSNASNKFSTPAGSHTFTDASGLVLLAHPADPHLFVGDGDVLYVFSASGIESSVQLVTDTDFQFINQFLWHDGELWIGFGNKILRRADDGTIYEFAEIGSAGFMGGILPGRFCINGGEVFTVDGEAISIANGSVRSWVSRGELSATQQTEAAILVATLSGGIYCSPDTLASVVYTLSTTAPGVVRMIDAL